MPRSRRPYLIRAIYDWALDNGLSPYIVVAADYPGVDVPAAHVSEGRITLNIGPEAVAGLDPDEDPLCFSARFGGTPYRITVPSGAVLAIYAAETGEGLVFGEVEVPDPDAEPPPEDPDPPPKRPHLRVVK